MRDMDKRKHLVTAWFLTVVAAMIILLALQYHGFTEYNRAQAFREAGFLISETEKIIAENDADREDMQSSLKQNNLEKAVMTARLLDLKPELAQDPAQLRELADTVGVDQIHLFDREGVIYGGTHEDYYGITLDDGEQIRYFKPMLEDKTLSMSQDLAYNPREGKALLYSMCWNPRGTCMVQVGTCGDRFPRLLNRNRIERFLELMPKEPTRDILITEAGEKTVVAATGRELVGKNLSDLGIRPEQEPGDRRMDFVTGPEGNPIYCTARQLGDFTVYIAQYRDKLNENIPLTLFTFAEYLVLVFIGMSFVIDYYYNKFAQAKAYAMEDRLTRVFSRRAYEMELAELEREPLDENLVLVSLDVNGLKPVNDHLGHQAGDLLLKGAADCISRCFNPYGKVFRFGGDEFAAIILAKEMELGAMEDFLNRLCSHWSRENGMEMTVSLGFAVSAAHPGASIHELEAIADQQMYAHKTEFYREKKQREGGDGYEGE